MLGLTTIKRLAAMTVVGGVLAILPALAPAANAATDCQYTPNQTADVSVSISPKPANSGDTFRATATVTTTGGAPATAGSVTFTYDGSSNTAAVGPDGKATSGTFTARAGGGSVSADYSGVCVAGAAGIAPATGSASVLGEEASAGGSSGGTAGVSGTSGSSGSSSGALADTGVDNQTQLLALLGFGLVTAGGISLVMHRRRVQA